MESQGYNFEYVYHDSGDREELEFVVETFSICQIEFSSHSKLVIKSQKDLTEILTQYNWVHPPIVLRSTPEQNLFLPAFLKDISGLTSYLKTSKAYAWAKYLKDNLKYQSEAKRTIYLIYSDEIFDWKSLTEATEGIIGYWFRQLSDNLEIEVINLKNNSNSHEAKKILALANEVVVIKISPTVANFLKRLRLFNPASCLCFYGFESSSIYFANTYRYELEPFLREEDNWVMSCKADEDLAKLSWENINTITIPLKFPDRHRSQRENNPRDLIYVGRYSEQKNLQDLIFAAYLVSDKMRAEGRKLKFFGYEDFLGVPNLGIIGKSYLRNLKQLVNDLELDGVVEFGDFLSHEEIDLELKNAIYISPSIHSDENFGLVAFRALNLGTPALLSDWGGHRDFQHYFDGVRYFNVYNSHQGPRTNPFEIALEILKIWDENVVVKPKNRTEVNISFVTPREKIKPSEYRQRLFTKVSHQIHHKNIGHWPLYGVIFENYQQLEYLATLKAYGAKRSKVFSEVQSVLSWEVELSLEEITVRDCRVRDLRYSRNKTDPKMKVYQFAKGFVEVTKDEWEWLLSNGHVHFRGKNEL